MLVSNYLNIFTITALSSQNGRHWPAQLHPLFVRGASVRKLAHIFLVNLSQESCPCVVFEASCDTQQLWEHLGYCWSTREKIEKTALAIRLDPLPDDCQCCWGLILLFIDLKAKEIQPIPDSSFSQLTRREENLQAVPSQSQVSLYLDIHESNQALSCMCLE